MNVDGNEASPAAVGGLTCNNPMRVTGSILWGTSGLRGVSALCDVRDSDVFGRDARIDPGFVTPAQGDDLPLPSSPVVDVQRG